VSVNFRFLQKTHSFSVSEVRSWSPVHKYWMVL